MTPKEAEEYVRTRWDEKALRQESSGAIYIYVQISQREKFGHRFSNWLAVADFTLQREEEIQNQQHRIEIVETARSVMIERGYFWGPVGDEIITSEKAQLAVLLVGWKETP